jgi:hypothetical protein
MGEKKSVEYWGDILPVYRPENHVDMANNLWAG